MAGIPSTSRMSSSSGESLTTVNKGQTLKGGYVNCHNQTKNENTILKNFFPQFFFGSKFEFVVVHGIFPRKKNGNEKISYKYNIWLEILQQY